MSGCSLPRPCGAAPVSRNSVKGELVEGDDRIEEGDAHMAALSRTCSREQRHRDSPERVGAGNHVGYDVTHAQWSAIALADDAHEAAVSLYDPVRRPVARRSAPTRRSP